MGFIYAISQIFLGRKTFSTFNFVYRSQYLEGFHLR